MELDVTVTIDIERPCAEVARFAADPDKATVWYQDIKSVEWKTPRPLRLGARVSFVAHFLGRRIVYTYEISEFVPGKRLLMRATEAPFPMETTYTWTEVAPARTRMSLRNREVCFCLADSTLRKQPFGATLDVQMHLASKARPSALSAR